MVQGLQCFSLLNQKKKGTIYSVNEVNMSSLQLLSNVFTNQMFLFSRDTHGNS